jgi:TPR repeat protein
VELWKKAAELGSSQAHFQLGVYFHEGGDIKKEKFHLEVAAMAGNEEARYNRGCTEFESGDRERAVKHWTIAASAGSFSAMNNLIFAFNQGLTNRESIDSSLRAYNKSCTEMRSDARDSAIRSYIISIGAR